MGNVQGVYGAGFDQIKAKRMSKKHTIVFVTNNKHKLSEVREILGDEFDIRSLDDIGCNMDIPETGDTFKDNALQKAQFVKRFYGFDCFADDSGLEVESLGGAPGVHSARYAGGDGHDDGANNEKLLKELEGMPNRKADFKTVIAYVTGDAINFFEGKVDGRILTEQHGEGGFGYDPLFVPDGYDKSFAEMMPEEKNKISHRARAVKKFADFLKEGK
jgi:non-canonical purine NTP pyrophosphatase (RdgB/HAM1 family)